MNKTAKWIIGVVVVLAVIVWGYFAMKPNMPTLTGPIKIGIILPLTGPASTAGEAARKTVELAQFNLPENIKNNIQIVYEDDSSDTKLTVTAAQKLIDVDKVNALITYSSASAVAASYVAEKSAIPMIGLGSSPDINTNKQWTVRYVPSSSLLINAMENLILKGKYKKVAVVWNQADGPKANAEQTVKTLSSLGYDIVSNESVAKTENDFRTSVTKLKLANPEAVIAFISPQVGVFAKQVQDMGWKIPLVGIINFESTGQIKLAAGGLDNQLYVGDQNSSFLDEYFTKYNMYPATACDNLYDAVIQMAKATTQNIGLNSAVMKYLRKDFVGVSGEYKYLGDGSYDLKQVVKTWNGNKFVEVK